MLAIIVGEVLPAQNSAAVAKCGDIGDIHLEYPVGTQYAVHFTHCRKMRVREMLEHLAADGCVEAFVRERQRLDLHVAPPKWYPACREYSRTIHAVREI